MIIQKASSKSAKYWSRALCYSIADLAVGLQLLAPANIDTDDPIIPRLQTLQDSPLCQISLHSWLQPRDLVGAALAPTCYDFSKCICMCMPLQHSISFKFGQWSLTLGKGIDKFSKIWHTAYLQIPAQQLSSLWITCDSSPTAAGWKRQLFVLMERSLCQIWIWHSRLACKLENKPCIGSLRQNSTNWWTFSTASWMCRPCKSISLMAHLSLFLQPTPCISAKKQGSLG